MSLFKEISILVFAAFLLLFALVSFDNSQQSGIFLRGQLQTTAQDTATVLGIAISTTGSGEDIAALETLFNAVFDSGYYSQIRLVGQDDSVIHHKKRELEVHGVPDWFIQAIPLNIAVGSSDVMQGWVPLGKLEVTLHPGFAYATLYQGLKNSVLWFSMLFLVVLSVLWFFLHIVLKPLKAIHQQANAIQANEFILQPILPRTLELRGAVDAMNRLVTKVRGVFEDHQQTLSRYHDLLYCDQLTGLRNRRFILSEIEKVVAEDSPFRGCIIIIKVQGLAQLREQKGYSNADDVVRTLADIIVKLVKNGKKNKYARISDDEFALLVGTNAAVAENTTAEIFEQFKQEVYGNEYTIFVSMNAALVSLNAGIRDVHHGDSHGKILSDLDLALAQAQVEGSFKQCHSMTDDLDLPEGKMQWRNWFRTMLDDSRFYLVAQPVFNLDKQCVHKEIFVRTNDNKGQMVPAGVFMPMALVLGFGLEIESAVFKLLKKISVEHFDAIPSAINLSTAFFCHADALDEFRRLLDHYKKHGLTLCVEASHAALQQYPDRCTELFNAVKQSGQWFGVDHLDINSPLLILQTIKPHYVKISAKVLDDLSDDKVSAAYRALRSLTRTLDIQLIAVGVDDPELYQRLLALGIDAVQGNLLGPPELIS